MPSTFWTYFGTRLLGMDVMWDNSTTDTLIINMTVNAYARIIIGGNDVATTGTPNGITGSAYPLVTPYVCGTTFPVPAAGGLAINNKDTNAQYKMGVVWARPNQSLTPKYDGVLQAFKIQLLCGASATAQVSFVTPAAATPVLDLAPTSISDITSDASPAVQNLSNVYSAANSCTEQWVLNPPYAACVKWAGRVSRKFNTQDTVGDFILEYVQYTMQAFAGSDGTTSAAPDYFGSKTVDLSTFLLPSTASDAFNILASASVLAVTSAILF